MSAKPSANQSSPLVAGVMLMLGLVSVWCVLNGLVTAVDEGGAALGGRSGTIDVETCQTSRPGFSCYGPFTPEDGTPVIESVEIYLGDEVAAGTTVAAKLGPIGRTAVAPGSLGRSWVWALITAAFIGVAYYCIRWFWRFWRDRPK